MHLLLLNDSKREIPASYLKKLTAWGHTYTIDRHTFERAKREGENAFAGRVAATVRSTQGDTVDFVQVFFSHKTWPLDSNIRGIQFFAFHSDYQVAFVREYGSDVAETAEHEFMHSLANFCRAYTGVALEGVMGVANWHDDVVHRRDPKTRQYVTSYDDVYAKVRPFVEAAIAQRRKLLVIKSLYAMVERLQAELRKLQVAGRPPEEIPENTPDLPENPASLPSSAANREKLYNAAYAALGKDLTPRDEVPDELACVAQLQAVFHDAFGFFIGTGEARRNTLALKKALEADRRFRRIALDQALPGDIAVCATGEGQGHGHCWVTGKTHWMSNTSANGKWQANYTATQVLDSFVKKRGFPLHVFRCEG